MNYVESSEDEEVFRPLSGNTSNARASKRRRIVSEDSDDEFGVDAATEAAMVEEGISLPLEPRQCRPV